MRLLDSLLDIRLYSKVLACFPRYDVGDGNHIERACYVIEYESSYQSVDVCLGNNMP